LAVRESELHGETRRGHAVICGEFSAGGPQRQVQQVLQPEPILADARDRRVAQRQAAPESSIACARDTPQTTGAARRSLAAGLPYRRSPPDAASGCRSHLIELYLDYTNCARSRFAGR
jgi:hypothetical protein